MSTPLNCAHKQLFLEAVIPHALALPDEEWNRLRKYASDGTRNGILLPSENQAEQKRLHGAARQEITETSCSSAHVPSEHAAELHYVQREIIRPLEGRPIYYAIGEGYYWWLAPSGTTWDVTLTWPKYPPNWG